MHDPITDVADAGSSNTLVAGWRGCRDDDERRRWLRLQLAVLQAGTPELYAAVREAERVEHDDFLEEELREAEDRWDAERGHQLLARRERYLDRLRREACGRVHAELVKLAVTTAITPQQ